MKSPPSPVAAFLAGLCAVLAACAMAPGAAPDGAGRSGARLRVLAADGGAPGAVPLVGPTSLAACTPTPLPVPSSSAPGVGALVIVSGLVFDPAGWPAEGAVVVARSLDLSVPYVATATTWQGSWVISNLPAGTRITLVAVHDGWLTPRYEFEAYPQATGRRNTIDLRAEPVYGLPVESPPPSRPPA